MASLQIPFSFDAPVAEPTEEEVREYGPPSQTSDGEEYLCGHAGNAHPYANPGRDQDRSRVDECQAAQPFARYVG